MGSNSDDPPDDVGAAAVGRALAEETLRSLMSRSRSELGWVADQGRAQMKIRKLRQDRRNLYEKMGRESRALIDCGDVTHPGLVKTATRIDELDQKIHLEESSLKRR